MSIHQNKEMSNDLIEQIQQLKDGTVACTMDYDKDALRNLEHIMEDMEEINKFILKSNKNLKNISIKEHLNFMMDKSNSFLDIKFENIFRKGGYNERKINNKRECLLDYGVKEKMVGFVSKNGRFVWNDEKIDDFLKSITNSNIK